jgi:hypothetical protein
MTYGRRHYITQQILVRLAYAGPTSAETREFLKATMRFLVALTLGFLTLAAVASGAELQEEASTGEFRYRRGPAEAFEVAPMVETRVRFDVTGVIARATVVQRFKNPLDVWIEGVYVFPLPEDAAVDHLSMRVGERVIEGQIREKQQAREEFRQAAAEGKRASLIEQERANLFTAAVANLGPNEELEVEIEYQETLDLDEGRVGLTFPLAITPRYTRGICNLSGTGGPSSGAGDVVATNPVSIELRLNAGFEVASLTSSTHPIDVEASSGQTFKARLRGGQVPADRDFEISWTPSPGVMPRSSVTTQKGPGRDVCPRQSLPADGPGRAVGAPAARGHLRDRHLGLDGGGFDGAGEEGAGDGDQAPRGGGFVQRHRVQLRDLGAFLRAGRRLRPRTRIAPSPGSSPWTRGAGRRCCPR